MKAYIISGLGANAKAFEKIVFPENIQPIFLPWIMPKRKESLKEYAQRMAEKIDDSQPFCLIGLSFGGIIVQEIHQWKKAEKIIIISSIKSENEKPNYMRFSQKTKLHTLIPTHILRSDKILSLSCFHKINSPRISEIKNIFEYRNTYYLRWSINKIINWKSTFNIEGNLFHIHGDKDTIFPKTYIKNAIFVENGTHIMILLKHKKISQIIAEILQQDNHKKISPQKTEEVY